MRDNHRDRNGQTDIEADKQKERNRIRERNVGSLKLPYGYKTKQNDVLRHAHVHLVAVNIPSLGVRESLTHPVLIQTVSNYSWATFISV